MKTLLHCGKIAAFWVAWVFAMCLLIWVLMWALTPVKAYSQTLTETNEPPVKVVVILLMNQESLPTFLSTITNFNARMSTNLTAIKEKETLIKLQEAKLAEYDTYPTTYIGDGSKASSEMLDKLIMVWAEKASAQSNLNATKLELKKLRE